MQAYFVGISSFFWMLMGHELTLDISLTFFMTLALLAYCESQRQPSAQARRIQLIMWIALAGAVLTKGFVALVLPAASFLLYVVWQRDYTRLKTVRWLHGALVCTLLCAPWMIAMQRRVPQFFDFFIMREHFLRYLTPIEERGQPWWFFLPILLAGSLPWIALWWSALVRHWTTLRRPHGFSENALLRVSAIVILVFFSASHSKLAPYVLPVFPIAWAIATQEPGKAQIRRTILGCFVVVGLAVIALATSFSPLAFGSAIAAVSLRWLIVAIMLMVAVSAIIARWSLSKDDTTTATAVIGAAWFAAAALIVCGQPLLDERYSMKSLTTALDDHGAQHLPVFSVGTYEQTIPFYLKRTVQLVNYEGELSFGIHQNPERYIPTLHEFSTDWKSLPNALAVIAPREFEQLKREHLPMQVIAHNAAVWVVAKPSSPGTNTLITQSSFP
jgi:4-amino-4-deoxy-L-arabinose transferase-like glycosyltransferase